MPNLSITTRLTGGFLTIVLLIALIGLIALDGLRRVDQHYRQALDAYRGRALLALEMKGELLEEVRAQKNYLLRGDPQYLEEASEHCRRVVLAHRALWATRPSGEDRELLTRLDHAMGLLDETFEHSISTRQATGVEAADAEMGGKAAVVAGILDEYVAWAQQRAQRERMNALRVARRTVALTAGAVVMMGLFAVGLALALSLSVTRPLRELQGRIHAMARGEAAPLEPAVQGTDEVGQIARAFHQLVCRAASLREMEARSRRLEALSSRVARAQEEERERIARELHDGLGQVLTAIKLDLAAAARVVPAEAASARERLAKAQKLADESMDELRRLAFDLRPPALDNLGLVAALEAYARRVSDRGLTVVTEADNFEPRLPFAAEIALYRICQEALTNVSKHARATKATVRLARGAQGVTLTVIDDGVGFDVASVRRDDGTLEGIGLLSMERRAEELGGDFEVESAAGQGTTVRVSLPLTPPEQT